MFTVYCRTGFHYADLRDFVGKSCTALQSGIGGELRLTKDWIKTDVTARVPQSDEAHTIVQKYGGWEKRPIKSNKTMNDRIKLIAAELKFHPDKSTRGGRKTFADWCFNKLGLTTDALKVMLGRKSDKGLELHGRPDERRVIAELNQSLGCRSAKGIA